MKGRSWDPRASGWPSRALAGQPGKERSDGLSRTGHAPSVLAACLAAAAVTAVVMAQVSAAEPAKSARAEAGAASKWCGGVHLRFFTGGNPGRLVRDHRLNGAKQAQADLGARVDYVFSGWNVERMVSQLREAIAAKPDGIAMMGHPGDTAIMPLAKQANAKGIFMEYQNVDVPRCGLHSAAATSARTSPRKGRRSARRRSGSSASRPVTEAIVFGAWGQPGRYFREWERSRPCRRRA